MTDQLPSERTPGPDHAAPKTGAPTVWTASFWKDAAERAVSTAAQSALAVLGADGLDLLHVDARAVLGVAAGGAVLSVVKALAARYVHDPDSASLVDLPAGRHTAPEA